jgi:hypothetical protein
MIITVDEARRDCFALSGWLTGVSGLHFGFAGFEQQVFRQQHSAVSWFWDSCCTAARTNAGGMMPLSRAHANFSCWV